MAAMQTVGLTTSQGSALGLVLPLIPELSRVPQRLHAEDEGELRWFLDDPPIAAVFKSGGFGAALERAEAFGYGALPCRKCGGTWRMRRRMRDGSEVVTDWRDGTGRRPKKHFGIQETYAVALARYRLDQQREHGVAIVSRHPEDPA